MTDAIEAAKRILSSEPDRWYGTDISNVARAYLEQQDEFDRAKLVLIGFVFNCKCAESMKKGDLLEMGKSVIAQAAEAQADLAGAKHQLLRQSEMKDTHLENYISVVEEYDALQHTVLEAIELIESAPIPWPHIGKAVADLRAGTQ